MRHKSAPFSKSFLLVFITVLFIVLSSCSSPASQSTAQPTADPSSRATLFEVGAEAIAIVDDYFAENISLEDAHAALKEICDNSLPTGDIQDEIANNVRRYILHMEDYMKAYQEFQSEKRLEIIQSARDHCYELITTYPIEAITPQQLEQLNPSARQILAIVDDYFAQKLTAQQALDATTEITKLFPQDPYSAYGMDIFTLRGMYYIRDEFSTLISATTDTDRAAIERKLRSYYDGMSKNIN